MRKRILQRDVLMNDKLSATHARWRDGVLAHNIVDVQHILGITNIADGISQQYEGTPKTGDDGSEWDVDSNLESGAGLVYGMNYVSIPPATQSLRDRFTTTPLFRDVIDVLEGIQSGRLATIRTFRAPICQYAGASSGNGWVERNHFNRVMHCHAGLGEILKYWPFTRCLQHNSSLLLIL